MIGRGPFADERGYTLMELAAASVPFTLIGLILFSVFGFTVAFSRRGEAQVDAVQQARLALSLMTQELREASAAPGAITIMSREEGAAQDGIGFLTARTGGPGRSFATDINGRPEWQEAVYYVHDRVRGTLRRLTGDPGALVWPPPDQQGRLLAGEVRGLHIEHHDDLITITLTVGTPPGQEALAMTVRPRN